MSQAVPLPNVDNAAEPSLLQRWCRDRIARWLQRLDQGQITWIEGERQVVFGPEDTPPHLRVTLQVADPRFYSALLLGGTVGAAEAYIQNWWSVSDLTALVRLLVSNREVLLSLDSGVSRLSGWIHRFYHWRQKNSLDGSRANIAAHYDLGNRFYSLFLDRSMMYSCAVFERPESSLEEASFRKNEMICRKLQLSPSDQLLEIGTGWGGFAIHAASRFGCKVTTATISQKQFEFARKRVQENGLSDRIEIVLRDYRELDGTWDKLVSIEMIEAVGHHFFDTFFSRCSQLLKPDGLMLLQAITINDQNYLAARDSVDFIKRYIFPGSCLPSIAVMADCVSRVTDFQWLDLEDLTPHYARTLNAWRERFLSKLDQVRRLGFGDEFIRMWNFYFCYCEGGFQTRYIGDVQILLAKPRFGLSI